MLRAAATPARLMSARFLRVRLAALLASAAALIVTGFATPTRAADSGLEAAVGPIPQTTKVLLPADSKFWGPYTLGTTPDLCPRGSIKCVDDTIAGMYQRFRPLARTCHHNAVFSLLYLRVTEGYKAVATTPGYFIDTPKVNKQDTDFARLYTRAYDLWYANKPLTVPPIWRLAFAAADEELMSGSGDALLGMVGHIKRDLPFALYRVALGHRADHLAINKMLKRVYPEVSAELARRFDSTIDPLGKVPGTGEAVVDYIATWRDQAWQDAHDLLAAKTTAEFNAVSMRIERSAWNYGLTLFEGARYPLGKADPRNTVRAGYCEQQKAAA